MHQRPLLPRSGLFILGLLFVTNVCRKCDERSLSNTWFAMPQPAKLALADGTIYTGIGFGASGEVFGEVCFNTSLTGYQEILTDPSYCGQIVTMTYPMIGNYGINVEDVESSKLSIRGFVIRELCREPSNFRSTKTLDDYLREANVLGIEGIDTRPSPADSRGNDWRPVDD
jgi:carbamoylphosphate synthase small subunit